MLSPKRISLLLAVTFVASLLLVIVTTLSRGQANPSNNPSVTVLRRKGQRNLPPTAAEIASFRSQQAKEERQLEDKIPEHVPIKVKIKKEKEESFKDPNNERWLRDLEIEVTNTGTKPIYFLDLRLHLPDIKGPDGNIVGWVLLYGRTQLVSVTEPLKSTDVPIKPGERYVFTIAERFVGAWEGMVREGVVAAQPKRVQVLIQLINFGDGTGFWGGTAAPLPHPKKPLAAGPCIDDKPDNQISPPKSRLPAWSSGITSPSWKGLPAFVPASFFVSDSSNSITVDASLNPGCLLSRYLM